MPRGAAAAPGPAQPRVALSVFEPAAGGCRWSRVDATTGKRQVVATFPGDCRGARVGFSPRVDRAMVWFDPSLGVLRVRASGIYREESAARSGAVAPGAVASGASARWYRVALPAGRPVMLPPAPRGQLVEVGFGAKGEALAFTLEPSPTLEVDGRKLPVPEGQGLPAIARAFRLDGRRWKIVETHVTRQGADLSTGIGVLALAADLGPRSQSLRSVRPEGKPVEDPAMLRRLHEFAPDAIPDDQNRWLRLATSRGDVFVWQTAVESVFSTGRMAFREGERLTAPPALGFGAADLVALALDGDHLLVAAYEDGSRPRLYDLARGATGPAFDDGCGASFWPRTRQ